METVKADSKATDQEKALAETEPLARQLLLDALLVGLVRQKVLSRDALLQLEEDYLALAEKLYGPRSNELRQWWSDLNPLESLRALGLEDLLDS